jgi:hypothetical protein
LLNSKFQLPGAYFPAIKKLPAGCIIYGDTLQVSDTCRSYALAGFTKDTVLITRPDQKVIFPWEVITPRWMQDDFGLSLILQGTGEPHFVEYDPERNTATANLRSERQFAQRQYQNGFEGADRDSSALASTAHLFEYPQEYTFSLQSLTPNKLKIDPKRKNLRVLVTFDPDGYSEEEIIICKGESTTLNAGPGSCFNWEDGSTQNPRTVSPMEDAEYSVTVLDNQLRAKIIRYKVKVIGIEPKITVETDSDEFCEDSPIKLKASPFGAQYTYLWNTGATTAEISVSSSSLLNTYRVTVTESRADSKGNVKSCTAGAEMGKEEVLAAVQGEKCNTLFDKLVELGFEAVPCTIVGTVPGISRNLPNLRSACNVTDAANLLIKLDGETINPRDLICADVEALGDMGRGFIFSSESICNSEQDLSFIEANLNENTVIYFLLRGCETGSDFLLTWKNDPNDIAELGEAMDYYFDHNGILIEKKASPPGQTNGSVYVLKNNYDGQFKKFDLGFVHEYVAIVVGESSDYNPEAKGIGSVIMNRMYNTRQGKNAKLDKNFVHNSKADGQYDAKKDEQWNRTKGKMEKTTYYYVTHQTLCDAYMHRSYGNRVSGAISALSEMTHMLTNEYLIGYAYFWEGAAFGTPGNWFTELYDNGTLVITGKQGLTTFFTYNPTLNPVDYKRGWP